jgi:hypothetical protein
MEPEQQQLETPVTPPAEKVVFTPEQQIKVDEITRAAMGRAAKEVRAEAAALKAENESLKANLATVSEQTKRDVEVTQRELADAKKQAQLREAVAKVNFVDANQVLTLTEKNIAVVDGQAVVLGTDGSPRLGVDGKPFRLESFFKEFAARNTHLVRGDLKYGVGSTPASHVTEYSVDRKRYISSLFGKGSDSKKANDLARTNLSEYRALKNEARRLKLIA